MNKLFFHLTFENFRNIPLPPYILAETLAKANSQNQDLSGLGNQSTLNLFVDPWHTIQAHAWIEWLIKIP